ncbi:MAG: Gfo/Idh/MocA family oxidoreductase [Chthoniobacterales bacterium]
MAARRTVRVGLIGYGFMGKAHSNAWRQAPRLFDLPTEIEMSPLCGRDARALKKAAATLGWKKSASDRRTVVEDPEIDLVDVATPNDSHAEIALARELSMRGELGERLFHFCARYAQDWIVDPKFPARFASITSR